MTSAPSLHQRYPASSVLLADPTSPRPFASLASLACRAYSPPSGARTMGISLVAVVAPFLSSIGSPTPGARWPLRHVGATTDIACGLEDNLGAIRQIQHFGAQSHSRPGHEPGPFDLAAFRVYASTPSLPRALQDSIPGRWLTASRVGFTPTCHHTISRTHLHVLVGLNRSAVVGGMATASEHVASLTSVAVAAILALWPLAEDAGLETGESLCSYAECQACSSTWWFPIGHGPVQIPLYLPLVPGWLH
jgi:hypothetical protein